MSASEHSDSFDENGTQGSDDSDMAVDDPNANGRSQADSGEPSSSESEETSAEGSRGEGTDEDERPEEDLSEEERLQRELDEVKEKLLRKTADFENFRKRMSTVREQAREEGRAEVAEVMLGVLDDFERSVEAARQVEGEGGGGPEFDTLKEGVEMVYQKFQDELAKLGIEPIEAEGRPFDESLHEAMMQKEAPENVEPGTVLQVLQRGYRMNDRVLRHARVVVAQ